MPDHAVVNVASHQHGAVVVECSSCASNSSVNNLLNDDAPSSDWVSEDGLPQTLTLRLSPNFGRVRTFGWYCASSSPHNTPKEVSLWTSFDGVHFDAYKVLKCTQDNPGPLFRIDVDLTFQPFLKVIFSETFGAAESRENAVRINLLYLFRETVEEVRDKGHIWGGISFPTSTRHSVIRDTVDRCSSPASQPRDPDGDFAFLSSQLRSPPSPQIPTLYQAFDVVPRSALRPPRLTEFHLPRENALVANDEEEKDLFDASEDECEIVHGDSTVGGGSDDAPTTDSDGQSSPEHSPESFASEPLVIVDAMLPSSTRSGETTGSSAYESDDMLSDTLDTQVPDLQLKLAAMEHEVVSLAARVGVPVGPLGSPQPHDDVGSPRYQSPRRREGSVGKDYVSFVGKFQASSFGKDVFQGNLRERGHQATKPRFSPRPTPESRNATMAGHEEHDYDDRAGPYRYHDNHRPSSPSKSPAPTRSHDGNLHDHHLRQAYSYWGSRDAGHREQTHEATARRNVDETTQRGVGRVRRGEDFGQSSGAYYSGAPKSSPTNGGARRSTTSRLDDGSHLRQDKLKLLQEAVERVVDVRVGRLERAIERSLNDMKRELSDTRAHAGEVHLRDFDDPTQQGDKYEEDDERHIKQLLEIKLKQREQKMRQLELLLRR